jgi:hypothetical protein
MRSAGLLGTLAKQEDMLANERSESRLARKHDAAVRCEAETKAIRVKMARRRAFRLADGTTTTPIIAKPFKPASSSLSDWQDQQQKDGRRG